jgi:hypothetical protein
LKNILRDIEVEKGFSDKFSLSLKDLEIFTKIIFKNMKSKISCLSSEAGADLIRYSLSQYHEFLNAHPEIDHEKLWPKRSRLLPLDDVEAVKKSFFFQSFFKNHPGIKITNEEGIYPEEIYWRVCRPLEFGGIKDVGPLHADEWFWKLGHGKDEPGYQRVKVWISIFNEIGLNGFRYVPGSHKNDYPYIGKMRDGFLKPVLQVAEDTLEIQPFLSNPGDAIFFHDRLLHGGMAGGNLSRVSIECTLLVPNNIYWSNSTNFL